MNSIFFSRDLDADLDEEGLHRPEDVSMKGAGI